MDPLKYKLRVLERSISCTGRLQYDILGPVCFLESNFLLEMIYLKSGFLGSELFFDIW
jgi:hypothetical protein